MKRKNRFAEFLRNLRTYGRNRHPAALTDIDACMSAMIDEPGSALEAEYESFASEYFYTR